MSEKKWAIDHLAEAVYGRQAKASEILGGADAKILKDAARAIKGLTYELDRLKYKKRFDSEVLDREPRIRLGDEG